MIHVCYFDEASRAWAQVAFAGHPAYGLFGLEPEVNDSLLDHCPELADAEDRGWLCEWAAILWHIRHPEAIGDWIGFTSYRQDEKSPPGPGFRLTAERVGELLEESPVVTWGAVACKLGWNIGIVQAVADVTLHDQIELVRPGINRALRDLFGRHSYTIPYQWYTETWGAFANYWAMRRDTFRDFALWALPLVLDLLAHWRTDPILSRPAPYRGRTGSRIRYPGEICERLVILWTYANRVSVADATGTCPYSPRWPS